MLNLRSYKSLRSIPRRGVPFLLYLIPLLALALTLNGCGQVSSTLGDGMPQVPSLKQAMASPTANAAAMAIPARLIIPAIQVNSPIEALGILPNGDMATPSQSPWNDTGWYEPGPLPGQKGSAVIDGHLDRPGGSPAVFWNLSSLHVGDSVLVVDTRGKTVRFHVTRVAFYTPETAPLQAIFGNSGGNYLNLITCAGDWIPSEHQTRLRLVVYTTLG